MLQQCRRAVFVLPLLLHREQPLTILQRYDQTSSWCPKYVMVGMLATKRKYKFALKLCIVSMSAIESLRSAAVLHALPSILHDQLVLQIDVNVESCVIIRDLHHNLRPLQYALTHFKLQNTPHECVSLLAGLHRVCDSSSGLSNRP